MKPEILIKKCGPVQRQSEQSHELIWYPQGTDDAAMVAVQESVRRRIFVAAIAAGDNCFTYSGVATAPITFAPVPRLGEFIICMFVGLDRQEERLGDMEEQFNLRWESRFGLRAAHLISCMRSDRPLM
jgi:hypothetical protein